LVHVAEFWVLGFGFWVLGRRVQPLTEPSMIPETKYRWTNGYTHSIGIRMRSIVADGLLALMALVVDPAAAAPSHGADDAPAVRILRNRVTGNSSLRSR